MSEKLKYTKRMIEEFKGISNYVRRVLGEVNISQEDIDRLFSVENEGISVVSSHRSHLDYLVAGTTLINLKYQKVRYAAGDNLTRLPRLGKKFKTLGAFSVYRGKASQRSYLFKLADFVKKILVKGHNLVVYPEGGRSYSGRMLEMKTGLLGASVMAQQENKEKDYYFMPVACSYTVVPDAKNFPLLLFGKKLRDQSKNPILKALGSFIYLGTDIATFLKIWLFPSKDYKVFIDVGEPLKIRDITDVEGNYRPKSKNQFFANGVAIKECASHVYDAVLKLFRTMPLHIVAYILLKEKFLKGTKEQEVEAILKEIKENDFNMKSLEGLSVDSILKDGFALLKKNGVLKGSLSSPKIKSDMLLDYFAGPVKDLRREP